MAALLRRANHRSGGKRDQSTQEPVPGVGRGRIALLAKGLLLEVPGAFTAVTRMRLKVGQAGLFSVSRIATILCRRGRAPAFRGLGGSSWDILHDPAARSWRPTLRRRTGGWPTSAAGPASRTSAATGTQSSLPARPPG